MIASSVEAAEVVAEFVVAEVVTVPVAAGAVRCASIVPTTACNRPPRVGTSLTSKVSK
jgi:hypothetical protein